MKSIILTGIQEHLETIKKMDSLASPLEALASACISTLQNGKKILICGNGGSAADAQHIAAELTGRFEMKRKGLAAIALTTDTSAMTAIANDFGFENIFSRQVEALAQKGDLFIGISTSGNSQNIIRALEAAMELECNCFGFAGKDGGSMQSTLKENLLIVPSDRTARIQEGHILIGHLLCELIEKGL